MGNIPVKLFSIWPSGSGGDVVRKSLLTNGRTDEGRRPIIKGSRLAKKIPFTHQKVLFCYINNLN